MKKILVMAVLMVVIVQNSWACPAVNKLTRGVENIVLSPVEVVKQTRWAWIQGSKKTFHISAWLLCGVVKGLVMATARIGSGVWDMATFPLSVPAGYASIVKPNNVFEQWPQREPGVVYKQFGDE